MIYLVFVLIVAAAAIYLYFAESRGTLRALVPGSERRQKLLERQHTIRLSLKDIEYETSVGKMDPLTAARLQNELVAEWEAIEAELPAESPAAIAATAAAVCKSCGTAVLTAAARFCHVCGAKLHQILLALLVIASATLTQPYALDINVTLQNGTSGGVFSAPLPVQLLKLEQGMQPVSSATTVAGRVKFAGLPEMKAGPYMVQTVYQGVTYSRVVPPNTPDSADIQLEVFESTRSAAKLKVRTLVELRRVDRQIVAGLMIVYFLNGDRRTFRGGDAGLEFNLPAAASVTEASVSVGTGASNIQWLKVAATKGSRPGQYFVAQSVKPGERILQVAFQLPYSESGTAFSLRGVYPQDAGFQLIAEPQDMVVTQGQTVLARVSDSNLGRGVISFPASVAEVALTLKGGGIAETRQEESAEVEIKSPLQLWQKLIFPFAAMAAFGLVTFFKLRRST